jgi:predicted amidohydrolase YtcJ
VDSIIIADNIYICDSAFQTAEAIAIQNGKVISFGTENEITNRYIGSKTTYNGVLYPGLREAHSHFYGYGLTLSKVDLRETYSLEQIIGKTITFAKSSKSYWITGRGWDQTEWTTMGTLTNSGLSAYFPDRPVFIKRIDGHAGLANSKALELAGITASTKVNGGTVEIKNGRLTGILTDNAMELVDRIIPAPAHAVEIDALLKAQKNCLAAGLTTVTDAGLDLNTILLIDSLQKTGDLTIRIYAMANPTEENFQYFEKNRNISTDKLQVSSFKIYADGSLGSRGAKLKKPYCDHGNHTGVWVTEPSQIENLCQRIDALGFQANTHCIGDSANRLVLDTYGRYLKGQNDKRWRIEHAQVVTPADRKLFSQYSILPSVQPTHATSDMNWADERLCKERMQGAYAYKSLLALNGYLPLGTDFPVEEIYPLQTFHAAVYRQDINMKPLGGYIPEESLSPKQALLGMTLWAAKANRMDDKVGSLEIGKLADYVVLDRDIIHEKYMLKTRILKTVLAK